MGVGYFYINNLQLVAKMDNHVPYVYLKGKGWVSDKRPMECMVGNNMDYDELTEQQAQEKINSL